MNPQYHDIIRDRTNSASYAHGKGCCKHKRTSEAKRLCIYIFKQRSEHNMKFYHCNECGEIIAVQEGETIDLTNKEEIIPNTVDAAKEKHVPVISREGQTVTVTVGEVAHPMTEEHHIAWILLETKNGTERKDLAAGEEPAAQFYVAEDDEVIAAYEYCTLHGIWKA